MVKKQTQHVSRGFTLVELMVCVGIIASMAAIMIPSFRAMRKSYESTGAQSMVNSALASARAIAIKERKYAGIRFQLEHAPKKEEADRQQYMVFIVSDEPGQLVVDHGFKAVAGLKPIKLPSEILILDMHIRTNYNASSQSAADTDQREIGSDSYIDEEKELLDAAAFSIIFSPSGRLVTQGVRVRNRDGVPRPVSASPKYSGDVFNIYENIDDYHVGMFLQDDYGDEGLGAEMSKGSFWEVSRERFRPVYEEGRAWSKYLDPDLKIVKPSYINAYTGEVINEQ